VSYNASRWLSRRLRVLVIGTAAGIAVLVSVPLASSAASSTPSSVIPAAAARQLDTIMLRVATMSGDPKPAWIEAVKTTRDKALTVATPGDTIPGSARQTVYLVVMKGNFTLNDASIPPHAHAPTGHYLAITFNPATFQGMDLGLSKQAPPISLRSLGPVSALPQQK
jgi:hypothetical protein